MKITSDVVVAFDYVLRNGAGELLDQSEEGEPMTYLHGHHQVVPGLERALEGRDAGEEVRVIVAPQDAYGVPTGAAPVRVPLDALPEDLEPEPGMALHGEGPDGQSMTVWIASVEDDAVLITAEHPLAGVTLHFEVTIRDVRLASAEELAHGHAHDPDGGH